MSINDLSFELHDQQMQLADNLVGDRAPSPDDPLEEADPSDSLDFEPEEEDNFIDDSESNISTIINLTDDEPHDSQNISLEQKYAATLEDLSIKLSQDEMVLVALDADAIDQSSNLSLDRTVITSIPGQYVSTPWQVIGIDDLDPDNATITLVNLEQRDRDPLIIPLDRFIDAWKDTENYLLTLHGLKPHGF
jgi:hypothetical protein